MRHRKPYVRFPTQELVSFRSPLKTMACFVGQEHAHDARMSERINRDFGWVAAKSGDGLVDLAMIVCPGLSPHAVPSFCKNNGASVARPFADSRSLPASCTITGTL